jgi:hypothetical protein
VSIEQAQLWHNPPDLVGKFRLLFGKTIEEWY